MALTPALKTRMMARSLIYVFFLAAFASIIFIWLGGSSDLIKSGNKYVTLIALGRLSGLLTQFLIMVQIILMGRILFIERQFGHDRLNRIHQKNGIAILFFMLAHPLLLSYGYSEGGGIISQILKFATEWEDILNALIALLIFITVIFSALFMFLWRRYRYEVFYLIHLFVYLAIFLVLGHQFNFGDLGAQPFAKGYWYIFNFGALALVIGYRFGRPIFNFNKYNFFIKRIVNESSNVISLYVGGDNISKFKYKAGQFANIVIMEKGFVFAHPFSISHDYGHDELRFSIKASGDFSSRIQNIRPGAKVIVDGPLGIFTTESSYSDKFLFLAGGIGITPIRSMIEHLDSKADIVLLYSARTEEDLVFRNELETFRINAKYFLTEQKNSQYENGRITKEAISKSAPDISKRDVYICGPGKFNIEMEKIALELGTPKKQIHYENFGY